MRCVCAQRIDAFNADYANCIDSDRLEDWPEFFTADGRLSRDRRARTASAGCRSA